MNTSLNIKHTPLVRTKSYITVESVDKKKRVIEWMTWNVPKNELLEIEEQIKARTCINRLPIGNERVVRWVCEPHIVDMFCTIAHALGGLCMEDDQFAQKVLDEAGCVAKEYDANNRWADSKRWLRGAKASIRNFRRSGNNSELRYKFTEIIHYFRLFDITAIDLFVRPDEAKNVTYKITSLNGGCVDLTIDYRGLTEDQMNEIDECLIYKKKAGAVSKELYNATMGIYRRLIQDGFVEKFCAEKKEYPYVDNFYTQFTIELVKATVEAKKYSTKQAIEILQAAKKTENLEYVHSDGKIRKLLFDFIYDTRPYMIERIED